MSRSSAAPRQRDLEPVALGLEADGPLVRLGAVARRVEVGAAREQQRIEDVEHLAGLGDARIVGGEEDRDRAGVGDDERVGPLRDVDVDVAPGDPGGRLERSGDSDDRRLKGARSLGTAPSR